MSEVLKPTHQELDTTSPDKGAISDSVIAYQGIRHMLLAQTENACSTGEVYWERDRIVDLPVDIGGLEGKIRYIPTFAYRQLLYDQRPACNCSLCGAFSNENKLTALPTEAEDRGLVEKINNSFIIKLNDFPYLANQIILASREHRKLFTPKHYEMLFDFMAHTKFAGAAMQLKGSGATIPEHAHISIFDERLPIFSSHYQPIAESDDVTVGLSIEHPSVCYKVYGESSNIKLNQTMKIIKNLDSRGLSYNLYFDEFANTYVIPRTNERSVSMNMKVGLSLPAGTYNGYIEHPATTDVDHLKQAIWQHCQEITGEQLATALKETTLQDENPAAIL